MEGDHVGCRKQVRQVHPGSPQGVLVLRREGDLVAVQEGHAEGQQAFRHLAADAAHAHNAHGLTEEVAGSTHPLGKGPLAGDHPVMGRHQPAHQRQGGHHHVLRHADDVGPGDVGHGDAGLRCGRQVHVVHAHAGYLDELEALGRGDQLGCDRVEGGGQQHLRVDHLLPELVVGSHNLHVMALKHGFEHHGLRLQVL